MRWKHIGFMKVGCEPVVVAVAFCFLLGGCLTQSPPPSTPPPPSPPPTAAIAPIYPPAFALSGDQMAELSRKFPDTYRRVQAAQPLSVEDIKAMSKIGCPADVIIAQVRNSHTVFHLTANAIIDLKNAGVSDQVIDFLISTPNSIAGSTPMPEPLADSPASQVPPPAPPQETAPPAPGPDYVWVGGDWVWNGGWVWVGGHWVVPPYPHALWIHGRWFRGGYGFRHERGHWR